jgi:hypothetical protein
MFLCLILSSCMSKSQENNSLTLININVNIKKMEVVKLSQFTNNIKYVLLENKENLTVVSNTKVDISDNMILIGHATGCILYDIDGHFISKIGNKGRGPGEYPYVTNLCIGKNSKIYLSDTENLYEYNKDGSFVKKYVNCFLNENYYLPSWILFEDSMFFGHVPNSTGKNEYKALIVDKFANVKLYYRNYIFFNRIGSPTSSMENQAHIYKFKNTIFYKELYNDTLFHLSAQLKLIPKYTFNLGRFKEPLSERENLLLYKPYKYPHLFNVFQTENYLFLDYLLGDYFPAKRLTPKPTPFPVPDPIMYNTLSALGIYEKKTGNLIFCEPTSTDNPLFTSGMYNDYDAGPRFFPKKQVNDSTMVMWIDAKQLKDHVASDDFINNTPKYPEKKRELEKLANSMSEFDNAVLMFVTFNK